VDMFTTKLSLAIAFMDFCALVIDVWVVCLQLMLCCCRKHTLNCHRMRPALFQVLCEIKEKTGKQ